MMASGVLNWITDQASMWKMLSCCCQKKSFWGKVWSEHDGEVVNEMVHLDDFFANISIQELHFTYFWGVQEMVRKPFASKRKQNWLEVAVLVLGMNAKVTQLGNHDRKLILAKFVFAQLTTFPHFVVAWENLSLLVLIQILLSCFWYGSLW